MDLQVLISKKGTKVVTATNLYAALQLPTQHYGTQVRKWLRELYQFSDGIRQPKMMADYARRPQTDNPVIKDYYISVELAKLIALASASKVKQKYAKWLCSLEDQVENAELLSHDQVSALMELVKAMGLVSCQEACERQNLRTYQARNAGSAANWWNYRARLMGYSTEELRSKLRRRGDRPVGKSHRHLLMQLDRYELIRAGIIDLFMALGKTQRYATNLGDLAKQFAEELQVEIFDDRHGAEHFAPKVNEKLLAELKAFEPGDFLNAWMTPPVKQPVASPLKSEGVQYAGAAA